MPKKQQIQKVEKSERERELERELIRRERETRKEKKKPLNLFNIIIAILLFLILVVGIIFLIRFFTFDRVNIHHTGIPDAGGDEGFAVLGEASVPAIPDIAVVNFSIENRSKTIRDAQSENTRVSNAVVERLRKEGVDEEDIVTTEYRINPEYRFDDEGRRILDGFESVQRFEAKIRAINNTGEILTALIDEGATDISELSFTLDDVEKLEDEALIKAISDARVLAETSVAATGHTLGRVISITEISEDTVESDAFSVAGLAAESIEVPDVYTGRQEIKKVVRVQFALN